MYDFYIITFYFIAWNKYLISLELHGRTWSMTWRELGPQSQRLPLVRHYTIMDQNPAARARSPCSSQHMSRPFWSLPKTIWMIQRSHQRRSCGQMRPKYNFLVQTPLAVFGGRRISTIPRTPSQPWSMWVETSCFGGAFLQRGQDDCTLLRGGWMGTCIARFWSTTSFPQ